MSERNKRKILVIDDDQDFCNMISGALETEGFEVGFEVISFSDSEKAIEKAKELEPSLIFVSLVLSRSNGLKVSATIHSIESLKNVPIFLLISSPEEFDKQYATYLGFKDVLVKSLNIDTIISEILKTIREDTVTFEGDEVSDVPSVEEESKDLLSEEKSGDLEEPKTLREDTATFEGDEVSQVPSVEEESKDLLSEEKSGDLEEPKTLWDRGELLGTSEEKIVEPIEDYEDEGLDKVQGREGDDFSDYGEKKFRGRLFLYAIALILSVVGIVAFLFIDTDGNFLNTFFKKSPEKKKLVQIEKILESISAEERAAEKAVPPVAIGESDSIITPPAIADKKEVLQKKPLSTGKPKAHKKIIYSVHIGAFSIEGNAVSLADEFKQKGYDSFIRKVSRSDKVIIHRVLIGKFDNREKALEQSKIIRQKEGLNSFVYQIEEILESIKPKAHKKIIYSVHIGAFSIEGNAVSLADEFKQKGYDSFIRKVSRSDKVIIHRVLIGKFDNREKALEQSKIIRQKEGLISFVYIF